MVSNHLFGYHDHSLYRKPSVAVVEQIFQGGSKEINDQDVVKTFLAEIIYIGNSSYQVLACTPTIVSKVLTASNKDLVCPVLISQLRCIAFSRFLRALF